MSCSHGPSRVSVAYVSQLTRVLRRGSEGLGFDRFRPPPQPRRGIVPRHIGIGNRGFGSGWSRYVFEKATLPGLGLLRVVKPIFLEERINFCLDDPSIPAGIKLK